MGSRCKHHGVPLEPRDVPGSSGKTAEVCPQCEAETRSRLERLFRSFSGDKEVRDGTCARPGCPEAEWRIHGYCSTYCKDMHLLELDLREEMASLKSQVAALSEALGEQAAGKASWQGRAEGLEEAAIRMSCHTYGTHLPTAAEETDYAFARKQISAPRPSPSRILEVVRAAETWAREASEDAWALRADGEEPTFTESELSLLDALESLTPEERQALGEEA